MDSRLNKPVTSLTHYQLDSDNKAADVQDVKMRVSECRVIVVPVVINAMDIASAVLLCSSHLFNMYSHLFIE